MRQVFTKFELDGNQPLEIETARESLSLRAHQSIHSTQTVVLGVALAGAGFYLVTPPWRIVGWALPIMAMAFVNARVCQQVLAGLEGAAPVELARRQQVLWWMTVINQLLVGTTVWWIGVENQLGAATIATTLQLIYIGGALINASTHPPTFVTGVWINLGIAALYWATHSAVGVPLSFGILGLALLLTRFSRQIAADFAASMRMRFENRDLLAQLAQEKQTAEEANAAKSRFLAAASHDLRQPLHALLVFSSLLGRSNSDPAALIKPIQDAASSLDKLFNGLLDISKLETGSVVPQLEAVNVLAAAEDLAREYSASCDPSKLRIVASGKPAWARTDPFLFERILRNLVDNAVKFTAAGEIRLEVEDSPDGVVVKVRDTGLGIPASMRDQIFEEYFQLGNKARDPARGTGLGLAIVRRLSQLLQAQVDVESQLGQGSVFSVKLSRAPAPGESASDQIIEIEPTVQGLNVWHIEDNPLVRAATTQALEAWGCNVFSWPGLPPAEVIDARASRPDAVIADYRLGGELNGLEVVQRVRAVWPFVPAAVMTGDLSVAFDSGVANVTLLRKPVPPDALVRWLAAGVSADPDPVARRHINGFGTALDTQFAVDDAQVGFHGAVADAKLSGN